MVKRTRQLGTLIALLAFAAYAGSQTVPSAQPAAWMSQDFLAYQQDLANAANLSLANLAQESPTTNRVAEPATDSASASADPQDLAALHQFARQHWGGDDEGVRRAVARVTQLRPLITPILNQAGVPDAVIAVLFVESAGQPAALSPKGARGVWQFMPETARRYGLTVNSEIDDRLDVQKSSRAAAQYLRDLHAEFGDWPLALAAYNAGEARVRTAIDRAGSRDFLHLDSPHLLSQETRAYVAAVLAASPLFTSRPILQGRESGSREPGLRQPGREIPALVFATAVIAGSK